jgi:hypothetical protein
VVASDLELVGKSMGMMGSGYGSECHLLRYLGRHRALLDQRILEETGATVADWLDYPFERTRTWPDGEWKALDFLSDDAPAKTAWRRTWPQSGNAPNWDAIGRLRFGSDAAWLLVEAKANVEELRTSCQASPNGGRPMIEAFLARTRQRLGAAADRDWLSGYYQLCNRLAALDLLNEHGSPAHLLNIYFVGDRGDSRRSCPSNAAAWAPALEAMKEHVGLPSKHRLTARIHTLFLPVCEETGPRVGTKEIAGRPEAAVPCC